MFFLKRFHYWQENGYSIHWTGSGREIAKAILFVTKDCSRLPFQSREVEEEFYLQLNWLVSEICESDEKYKKAKQ